MSLINAEEILEWDVAAKAMSFEQTMDGLQLIQNVVGPDLGAVMRFLTEFEEATGLPNVMAVMLAADYAARRAVSEE